MQAVIDDRVRSSVAVELSGSSETSGKLLFLGKKVVANGVSRTKRQVVGLAPTNYWQVQGFASRNRRQAIGFVRRLFKRLGLARDLKAHSFSS